jgi:hypothetical protein
VQRLFDALDDPTTPFALGTRYGPGVEMDKNWPLYRRIISWGARSLARPLTSASDPMTGFFGIRKDLVRVPLNIFYYRPQWLNVIIIVSAVPTFGAAEPNWFQDRARVATQGTYPSTWYC